MNLVVWLTGLSSSGKSTLAKSLDLGLRKAGKGPSAVLDADVFRRTLWPELDFNETSRRANIFRLGFLANYIVSFGVTAIVASVSPFRDAREKVRAQSPNFLEVYLRCPLSALEARDTNGVYRRYRSGDLKGIAGIDSPYEAPDNPEIMIDTDKETIEESTGRITQHILKMGVK
jgi:adenylyl-sulfate kinase